MCETFFFLFVLRILKYRMRCKTINSRTNRRDISLYMVLLVVCKYAHTQLHKTFIKNPIGACVLSSCQLGVSE